MRALTPTVRRLLPYYRPYTRKVALGLLFVVLSSAVARVAPWLLGLAVVGLRSPEPPRRAAWPAAGMVAVALVIAARRYWLPALVNGVSR